MRQHITTALKFILIFALVAILINDTFAYFYARSQAQSIADEMAETFARHYEENGSVEIAYYYAKLTADRKSVSLKDYNVENYRVTITVSTKVMGTALLGKVKTLSNLTEVTATGSAAFVAKE